MEYRGKRVLVRTYGDYPCIRRLWDIEGRVAYVVEDERFEDVAGGDEAWKVGVPLADLFEYDPKMRIIEGRPYDGWSTLRGFA
jgi:hypothetical protein